MRMMSSSSSSGVILGVLRRAGATIILATHHVTYLESCDRVLFMDAGNAIGPARCDVLAVRSATFREFRGSERAVAEPHDHPAIDGAHPPDPRLSPPREEDEMDEQDEGEQQHKDENGDTEGTTKAASMDEAVKDTSQREKVAAKDTVPVDATTRVHDTTSHKAVEGEVESKTLPSTQPPEHSAAHLDTDNKASPTPAPPSVKTKRVSFIGVPRVSLFVRDEPPQPGPRDSFVRRVNSPSGRDPARVLAESEDAKKKGGVATGSGDGAREGGGVSWRSLKAFADAMGGVTVAVAVLTLFPLVMGARTFTDWWVGYWIRQVILGVRLSYCCSFACHHAHSPYH